MITDTKKFGCPAKVEIKEIVEFPEYQINDLKLPT